MGINTGNIYAQRHLLEGWKTDNAKSVIDPDELVAGGPPKDGIPSIDNPELIAGDRPITGYQVKPKDVHKTYIFTLAIIGNRSPD